MEEVSGHQHQCEKACNVSAWNYAVEQRTHVALIGQVDDGGYQVGIDSKAGNDKDPSKKLVDHGELFHYLNSIGL
jgi:hypothetical protein